jgi:VIT1/CCC1 family predicted Fe2+/Mn2+ transporter
VLPTINTLEHLDSGTYDAQPEAVASGLPAAERSHARIIKALATPVGRGFSGSTIARLEGRHRALGGNALRAAVLGANDGLCSNLSLVMGVAGADLAANAILVTGLAGLLAGACSMALGEWLSVSTTRESYQQQIKTEADELEQVPQEEEEELALIYQAKGLPEDQARALAQRLIANKGTALDTLVREELGIDPEELGGSAWAAAGTSFLLFAIGAIFPVAPYFVLAGGPAAVASLAASGAALFLGSAAGAGRFCRCCGDLRHRQADRSCRYGLRRRPPVRARNSARASWRCRLRRCGTVRGRHGPPSTTGPLSSILNRRPSNTRSPSRPCWSSVQFRTGPVSIWIKPECGYQPTPPRCIARARVIASDSLASGRMSRARPTMCWLCSATPKVVRASIALVSAVR